MKKYLQLIIILTGFFFLVLLRHAKLGLDDSTNTIAPIKQNSIIPQATDTPTPTPSTAANPQPTTPIQSSSIPTPTPAQAGMYKNGTFTGSVQDAYYGNIQVQVIISGGKLTDVVFLQYPNDNGTSQSINGQAMPLLKQEAIQAQSANVSGVSGASATSPAFIASLTDALSQAKN